MRKQSIFAGQSHEQRLRTWMGFAPPRRGGLLLFWTPSPDCVRCGGLHPGLFSTPPYGMKGRFRPLDASSRIKRDNEVRSCDCSEHLRVTAIKDCWCSFRILGQGSGEWRLARSALLLFWGSAAATGFAGDPMSFRNGVDLVRCRELDDFFFAGGPMDFSGPCIGGITKAKVNAHVIGRQITAAAEDIAALTDAGCIEVDSCSYCVSWAPGTAD